ncbi:MAG: helix-turn-helix domain-containing protein [Oribacterium sp.]|nr:helix-turn-helix domain-containing protein [Oribacterium sp.]
MNIRDRIFQKLTEMNMTQKKFAKLTGIPETTVSDWKKKKTNPTSEKILVICKVLNVTPEWLLSGVEVNGTRSNPASIIAVDVRTEAGELISTYNSCDAEMQARILGYAQAISRMMKDKREKNQ